MSLAELLAGPVVAAAQELIGWTLRHGECAGVVVEAEAYHHDEPACHAYVGVTPRTETLFGPPGRAYVYRSYGIHSLFNAVCEPEGTGAAVLIRALAPVDGLELMRARRGVGRAADLCSGPGKLTQALGIGLDLNAADLLGGGPVTLEPPREPLPPAFAGPRIGITKAVDLPWRFCAASEHVSRPWPPGLRESLSRTRPEAASRPRRRAQAARARAR